MIVGFGIFVFIRDKVISRLKFRNSTGVCIHLQNMSHQKEGTGQRTDGDCRFQHTSFEKDHVKSLHRLNSAGMLTFGQ